MAAKKSVPESVRRINRRAQNNAATPSAPIPADPKPAVPSSDLDDAERQRAILDPPVAPATIAGADVELHPLPAQVATQFTGLMIQVWSEAVGRPGNIGYRIAGVLTANGHYTAQFARFVARAQFPTAEIPAEPKLTEKALRVKPASELEQGADFAELAVLVLCMMDQNGVTDTIKAMARAPGDPK